MAMMDPRHRMGTTSACAENTELLAQTSAPRRNYLRVRGEYPPLRSAITLGVELPPRARRILPPPSVGVFTFGTTSACAENTASDLLPAVIFRNYLRVRGEYAM